MREGHLGVPLDAAMAELADLASWTASRYPNATSVEVGTGPYHHAGASSTQDLAFAVGTAVEYLRAMTGAGLGVDAAARQIVFGVSLGTQFFRAIAKLRALRLMWSRVVAECGGDPDAGRTLQIRARTSRRVLTSVDPWVNLLRNTVCCFAGAVGGADSITTAPMDAAIGLSDQFSRHLARNTQIILQEESHLNRVIDPAGGSWFIETLTAQLAEKAWAIFRQVEGRGGMIAASAERAGSPSRSGRSRPPASGTSPPASWSSPGSASIPMCARSGWSGPRRIASSCGPRRRPGSSAWRRDHGGGDAPEGPRPAVGDAGRSPGSLTAAAVRAAREGATIGQMAATLAGASAGAEPAKVTPMAVHPYAAAFEELRGRLRPPRRSDRATAAGLPGEHRDAGRVHRPVDLCPELLPGGRLRGGRTPAASTTRRPPPTPSRQSGAKIAVICSTDKKYEEVAEPLAAKLKAAGARTVVLAGNPGANDAAYRAAGIDRFIFMRCDVLGTLRDLLREEGVLS